MRRMITQHTVRTKRNTMATNILLQFLLNSWLYQGVR